MRHGILLLLFALGCNRAQQGNTVERTDSVISGGGQMEASCSEGWLRYEPAVVTLSGRVVKESRYGAPNYGETPEEDEKLVVPFLELDTPISICADSTSETNREAAVNVSKLQLILTRRSVEADTHVQATGRLFRALTGRHFSEVVMEVDSLR